MALLDSVAATATGLAGGGATRAGTAIWRSETRRALVARAAFALTVFYAGLIFWLAPHPPMADLPQHAGQVVLLRELLFGQTPWASLLRVNYFTPYLIGYWLTLPLTFLMPVADAMKLLLMVAFYGFVLCCLALRRQFQGDDRLDWLFIPGFFGFAYAWGFFTFLIATPVGLLFVLLADRYARRPARASGFRLCVMGVILFFSHGLVFLFASCVGVALLLVRTKRWPSVCAALLPYLPLGVLSAVYAIVSHQQEAFIPNGPALTVWREWELRLNFISHIFSSAPYDANDTVFVVFAGVMMLWAPRLLPSSFNRMEPAAMVPLAGLLLVWLAAPFYAMKTTFVYHRFALFILPFYALMFCRPAREGIETSLDALRARGCQLLLAALCWLFLAGQTERAIHFAAEAREFDIVRAAVEPAQRALSLVLDDESPAAKSRLAYHHHPLWYQVENGGLVDFNFALTRSQVVRYWSDKLPALQLFWKPNDFNWTENKGWLYRYFFVRHTQPLPPTFLKNEQCEVALLKSAGSWSVYETKRCRY